MYPGRLFTFGCSMTQYYYPTWADILGKSWQFFENHGEPGSGNHCIFNKIIQVDAQKNFTSSDTVIVMWSGVARLDTYIIDHWSHHINLFPDDPRLNKDTQTLVNCPIGYELQSYAFMHAIDRFLTKSLRYIPLTWTEYDTNGFPGEMFKDTIGKIKKISIHNLKFNLKSPEYFSKGIEDWASSYQKLSGPDWPSWSDFLSEKLQNLTADVQHELNLFRNKMKEDKQLYQTQIIDQHPSPTQHLLIAKQIFPDLSIDIDTIEWLKEIELKLQNKNETLSNQ